MIRNPTGVIVESNGGLPVNLQDQTTPTIIIPMVQHLGETTLAADTVVNTYTATLTDATGFVIGNHFRTFNVTTGRYYYGTVLNVAANVITLDTQFDAVYPSGAQATRSNVNMAVDGSGTPVIFHLREDDPAIIATADITRIIITCVADSPVAFNLFGNIAALTRGLAFRNVNGTQYNIFNVKTNQDLAGIAYDFTPYLATNPAQGVDGFSCRLTFAGQNKIGVSLRVNPDDNLQMLVQDDLTGLTSLIVMLEGHLVTD